MLESREQLRGFRALFGGIRKRAAAKRLAAAVVETLEERRLLAGLVDYVIQISVDGLRPDAIANTSDSVLPNFHRLRTESAWTDNARCDYNVSETLPNHVTVITGRPLLAGMDDDDTPYEGHTWNANTDDFLTTHTIHSMHTPSAHYIESVFDTAHDYNLRTTLIAGKNKFRLFRDSYDDGAAQYQGGALDTVTPPDNGRNKIDYYYSPQELDWWNSQTGAPNTSWDLLENDDKTGWLDIMRGENDDKDPFQYSFLHFRDPDKAGHYGTTTPIGWGGHDYNHTIENVDLYLGAIFDLIDNTPQYAGRTAIVLTADHGGGATGATNHNNPAAPVVYTIPFYVWGPGIAQNGTPTSGDHGKLYDRNTNTRTDPSSGYVNNEAVKQPIRNGDASNVALDLLGLPAITHSYFNKLQNLDFGMLKLTGTESADTISVVVDTGDSSSWEVTGAVGGTQHFTIANYASIRIDALGGNDSVTVSADVTVPCVINGGDGNDNLLAGSGDDHIDAGAGNDTLTGMDGNDTLDGGAGTDVAEYNVTGTGAVHAIVNTGTDAGQDGFAATDTFAGIENLSGGPANDTLYGDDNANKLWGNAGDDSLIGNAGNDTYVFSGDDLGTDHIDEAADANTDTVDFSAFGQNVGVYLGNSGTGKAVDSFALILYLSDESSIETVKGGPGNDTFNGNSRDNVFYGNAGADTFMAGPDTGTGKDTFYGGTGTDTADYSERQASVSVCLDGSADDGSSGEQDSIKTDVENLIGGKANDALNGSTGPNYIQGGTGDDTIHGMDGSDTLDGENGDDQLYANDGSYGGAALLIGNADDDTIYGSSSADTIWGDHPSGSNTGTDSIYGLAGNDTIHGGRGDDTAYGGYGDDYLYGDDGEDYLYADNTGAGYGDDTLDGGDDADHLYGGNGNDLFIGTADDHNDVFDGQEMSDTLTGHDAGDTHYNIEVFN